MLKRRRMRRCLDIPVPQAEVGTTDKVRSLRDRYLAQRVHQDHYEEREET